MFSLFCEDVHLEYVRIHVIYSVHQAEYVVHIRVVAPQEYVNIYSPRRDGTRVQAPLRSTVKIPRLLLGLYRILLLPIVHGA